MADKFYRSMRFSGKTAKLFSRPFFEIAAAFARQARTLEKFSISVELRTRTVDKFYRALPFSDKVAEVLYPSQLCREGTVFVPTRK
ncbi:hypothetical protein BJL95_18655 [Methylomonas sp. LWB]|nr:hypothetical protein BJL95_18655 [Methylomonas sp. LWB]